MLLLPDDVSARQEAEDRAEYASHYSLKTLTRAHELSLEEAATAVF